MTKKLPKRIYVAWEEASNDEPFLMVEDDYRGLALQEDERNIGVYELVEEKVVMNKSELV